MYAGVPTVLFGSLSMNAFFEYPKSQIFNRGTASPSSSVFSNFKSLCATPLA